MRQPASDEVIEAMDRLTQDSWLTQKHRNYSLYHCAFNHDSRSLDAMIAEGIVRDASKPFDWSTCDTTNAALAQFSSTKEHFELDQLIPYLQVEVYLAGPFAVDNPNGNMYLFSAIARATGEIWVQPLKSKADAW